MFYCNMIMKMLKCKKGNFMTSHFSTLLCYIRPTLRKSDECGCIRLAQVLQYSSQDSPYNFIPKTELNFLTISDPFQI